MNSLTLFVLSLFLMVMMTAAQMTPSPEPEEDPMRPTVPVLYLSQAGPLPVPETMISSYSQVKVCARDYPNGWTIRCDTKSKTSVIFRVNGAIWSKEYFAPYYLSGNWKGGDRITPFVLPAGEKSVRISCRVRTRAPVWVDLIKEC